MGRSTENAGMVWNKSCLDINSDVGKDEWEGTVSR